MSPLAQSSLILGAAGAALGALHLFGIFHDWEQSTVDFRLSHRPKTPATGAVKVVAVGDDDVADPRFGTWPFPRSVHSNVVRILRATGVSHITFDFLFNDRTDDRNDGALSEALSEADDVTLAYHFQELRNPAAGPEVASEAGNPFVPSVGIGHRFGLDVDATSALVGVKPVPLFQDLSPSLGFVNVVPDANNSVIRRIPMFVRYEDKLYPGLALQTVIATLRVDPDQIRVDPGREIRLVDTRLGTLRIPIDEQLQYRINFTSGIEEFVPAFQYGDLFRAVEEPVYEEALTRAVSGRPVVIGIVSTGTSDIVTTPIGRLPGVLAQATAVGNILTQNHLRFFPPGVQVLWCGCVGLLLGWTLRLHSAWAIVSLVGLFVVAYSAASGYAAVGNWMLPLLPVLELSVLSVVGMLWYQVSHSRSEQDRAFRVLNRYVSAAVARRALREESFASEPTERRKITIFFSDIRKFTNWSERKEPEEITSALNEYLKSMTEVVEKHGGTLDKFMGDGIMVLFNAPENQEDHPERALRMALEMQERVGLLNDSFARSGREPVEVGMGIHVGYATVGNFGSDLYSDYTAIGNSVNLAARIEGDSGGEIHLSESANLRLRHLAETESVGKKKLKGIQESVPVFRVIGLKDRDS